MYIQSASFDAGTPIPPEFAFCRPDPEQHAVFSDNRSPALAWGDLPQGTRSLVLLCVDTDVPTVGDDVNQEGRTVPRDLPRTDFTHWVMVDVPATCTGLAAGECSDGVTAGGKQDPPGPAGARQGVNDYTGWFAGDPEMGGTYRGYDGPGPPWNDELVHHYHFQLCALDVERLDLDLDLDVQGEGEGEGERDFTAADVRAAMQGHVLGEAQVVGTYTQNPDLL